jgi:SET domain-containing protein
VCATGLCSMYNHDDTPNAEWRVVGTPRDAYSWRVIVTAIRSIAPGDEIFISYGDDYWKARPHLTKQQ